MTGPVDPVKVAIAIAKHTLVILVLLLFLVTSYFLSASVGKSDLQNIPVINKTEGYQRIMGNLPDNVVFFPEVKANADPWYSRVVTPGEMDATAWINENTNGTDKFVADIFGAELIMGMTTRVSTVGGDWANAPDPVKYMSDTNTIYTTNDPKQAYDLAKENNCSYVWLPNRNTFSGYEWVYGDHAKFDDPQYFDQVYNNSDVTIYKVL